MAVSGRKIPVNKELVSGGLEEDFGQSWCGPCLAFDKQEESCGFCMDCHEYLCKNCYIYHQRVKATKHHRLLDKDQMCKEDIPPNNSDVCTERCSIHKNEVIKFFCPKHDELGCTDCMTLNHRACDLDYIPDKCKDIGDSREYRDTIRKIEEKSNEVNDITSKAVVKDKEIDEMHDAATKDIRKYRQEINDRLDVIQTKSETEVINRRSSDKQKVQSVIASCNIYSSEINKLQSSLQDSKTRKEHGQLFIALKRAKSALTTTSIQQAEESLDKVNAKYEVKRNEDIKGILNQEAALVKLCELPTKLPTSERKTEKRSLSHLEDINVKTNTDKETCYISGCEILTTDKIVLADNINKAVKIVDLQRKVVIEEKTVDICPCDIAVLPESHIAVTTGNERKILILTTASTLSINNTFTVEGDCYGIVFHENKLYVVCQKPRRVLVLDMKGNVNNTISLDDDTSFFGATYIAKSSEEKSIYVSTWGTSPVIRFTSWGVITAVYNGFKKDVQKPGGMLMIDDGSVLVCCYGSGEIYRLSKGIAQGRVIKDGLNKPRSISYCSNRHEVYVGSSASDYVKVFRLL
ncbi:uncharacterized protein LOC123535718 [Mercenaria mercenaria]|uniref:uncharacterized protein LOC123535718 n=1 Tax=Mercenaria mercenaria TaxID=6596 RepID=UPI00234F794B|nr:uncharacterized protein LOC123535718 [Mercenaria mercenaria]